MVADVVAHAESDPDRIALRGSERGDVTYAELVAGGRRWAEKLPTETRIAICPRSEADSVAALIGAWMARSSVVLMHRHLTGDQAASVISQSRASAVVTESMDIERTGASPVGMAAGELLVGLTSGTSGAPKLFARSHASWIATLRRSDELVSVGRHDLVAVPGAIDHSHFLYGLVHSLHRGAMVDLRGTRDTDWRQADVVYSVPTIAADLVTRGERLDRTRAVLSSGAAWPSSARAQFEALLPAGGAVHDFYGAGELSFVSSVVGRAPAGCLGRPFSGVDIQITTDAGETAEPGRAGLIEVSSDMVFSGYLGPTGEVEAPPTRWVTAGDHGYLDAEGRLYLTGRQSRMFTRGALNVEPEAVERALTRHPRVTAAACVPQAHDRWGQVPVAFVAVDRPTGISELDHWCVLHLDAVHRPLAIHILDELPTTHRGKTDYRDLGRRVDSGEA